jgi:hypothetical protein
VAPFRRRPADPEAERLRDAFAAVAERLAGAQRALLAAIPTARTPGIPLALAVLEFEKGLDEAEASMPGWRHERTSALWEGCRAALVDARRESEALRLDPADLGFEALNARIGDVLAPLERLTEAERALRRI